MGPIASLRSWSSNRKIVRRARHTVGLPTKDNGTISVEDQLLTECQAMSMYAMRSGLRVPAFVLQSVASASESRATARSSDLPVKFTATQFRNLTHAHDQLTHIVAPAKPGTLAIFEHEASSGRASALGPIPLVRNLMITTGILLIVFLVTATSGYVNSTSGDIFSSSGIRLAVNEVFLLSAAGIGAAFAALFQANRYIAQGTYEPKYESSYWIRFVLGLLAGIVLASLIPIKSSGSAGGLSKPFLALLGGFSAAVVFKILTQVVTTLESLVTGDPHAVEAAKVSSAHAQAANQRTLDHMRFGAGLVKLREQIGSGASPNEVSAQLNSMLAELLPADYDDDSDTTQPASTPLGAEQPELEPAPPAEPAPSITPLPAPESGETVAETRIDVAEPEPTRA
jgi:hypothetical protein